MAEELLEINRVARLLHLTPHTIKRYIKTGKLRAVEVGSPSVLRIPESELDKLIKPVTPSQPGGNLESAPVAVVAKPTKEGVAE